MNAAKFHALAANRLSDGVAVWAMHMPASKSGFAWTEDWAVAASVEADGSDALMAWGTAEAGRDTVVSERLIDVALVDGSFAPTRLRERIVATGPTVRLDLGKQAEQRHAQAA